ncbi:FlxA-like family protein [Lachnoclostridium phytofermentans]|uniref:Uncharacterized protein n=1 Tax=Lachnoclostridium phytofermentans (strain ATCC 700394 / DSM 18823 / ISDg) TaxID=357809 RepID=A9KTD8_LACP7|nr:FlxA-like family protein [Lachnoclostridium phytofermentans]ABX43768.1 hypothetical protein Cphy_3415 [Lachnoclostridium phytofermentans ISDg]
MNIGATQGYSYSSSLAFGQNQYTNGLGIQESNKSKEERSSINAAELSFNKQGDSFLESLREQYKGYQEELNSLSANEEMTPEEKLAKRKEIQEQIDDIKSQIALRQQQLQQQEKENAQKEIEKRQRESASNNKDITEEEYRNQLHQKFLTEASNVMSEVGIHKRLKVKTEGELRVASIELKSSMARSGGASKSLTKNVSEAKKRLSQNDIKLSEKLGKLNELANAQKDELKNQEKDSKNSISLKEKLEETKVAKERMYRNNSEIEEKEEKRMDNRYDKHVNVLI